MQEFDLLMLKLEITRKQTDRLETWGLVCTRRHTDILAVGRGWQG